MVMDYAWDWGRVAPDGHREQIHHAAERRDSLPPLDIDPSSAPSARLRNVEENPFLFVFDSEGRSHTFELSLSDASGGDDEGIPEAAKQSTFLEHRITFQKFIESPHIVDDPRLVVRYSLQ
jgi:phosphatidate phosphatase LPIN